MKIPVHKYHSVRHDQREPSAVSAHDEDETDAGVRRPTRHEARLYHQLHKWRAKGAPPRPSINMLRMDSAVLLRKTETKERSAPQRFVGCSSDQKSGLQGTWTESRLIVRHRESQRHGVSEFLRDAFALFFGVAKAYQRRRPTVVTTRRGGALSCANQESNDRANKCEGKITIPPPRQPSFSHERREWSAHRSWLASC